MIFGVVGVKKPDINVTTRIVTLINLKYLSITLRNTRRADTFNVLVQLFRRF